MCLISIITVCMNAEEYLEKCIESVVSQTYTDCEYIVIDGGSTDRTVSIIREYEQHLAYWHSMPDRGLAHAFNLGVENSKGQWLIYLNSDDYFSSPDVLASMAPHLEKHAQADVVFGQVNVVSREQQPVHVGGPYGQNFSWSRFTRHDTIPHQAAFTSRAYFSKVGPFSESMDVAVDYEHYLRGGSGLNAVYVPTLVANMRDGGLSKNNVYFSMYEWALAQHRSGARSHAGAMFGLVINTLRLFVSGIVKKTRTLIAGN